MRRVHARVGSHPRTCGTLTVRAWRGAAAGAGCGGAVAARASAAAAAAAWCAWSSLGSRRTRRSGRLWCAYSRSSWFKLHGVNSSEQVAASQQSLVRAAAAERVPGGRTRGTPDQPAERACSAAGTGRRALLRPT